MTRRAALLAATLLLAACGSNAATPSPIPPPSPTIALAPTTTPAVSSTAGPAAPTASAAPSTAMPTQVPGSSLNAWGRIGSILGSVEGLVGSEAGYVAFGGDGDASAAWFSRNGTDWTATELTHDRPACATAARYGLWTGLFSAGADGTSAIVVGNDWPAGSTDCRPPEAVAWTTTDGRSWSRTRFDVPTVEQGAHAFLAWPSPDGWEAAVEDGHGAVTVHRLQGSGTAWTPLAQLVAAGADAQVFDGAAGDGGRRMVSGTIASGGVKVSSDGVSWRRAPVPWPDDAAPGTLLAPVSGTGWVAVVGWDTAPNGSVWVWGDDGTWRQGRFPMPKAEDVIHTQYGLVATGGEQCFEGTCTDSGRPTTQFRSDDGLTWRPLDGSIPGSMLANGPTGLIGLTPERDGVTVWRYAADAIPAAAAALLAAVHRDARVACAPRDDLPSGATAAVECRLGTAPVDRVGVYQFPGDREAADAYRARLADEGVRLGAGDCVKGRAGDADWDGRGIASDLRFGCFKNDAGVANVRLTCGGGVYVGILGTSGGLADLVRWTLGGVGTGDLQRPRICGGSPR